MSNGAGRVPVFACVRGAWQFVRDHWTAFVPAAAISAVISELGSAAALLTGSGAEAVPATPGLLNLILLIPGILAGLMFTAAVLRKSVREEFKHPTGLNVGADEGRLFGVAASATLLAIPIFLLLTVVVSFTVFRSFAGSPEAMEALAADPNAFAEAMVQAMGPVGALLFLLACFAVASIAIGLLSLANAATIGERKIVIFQAFSWMKGNTLRVFAATLLTVLPVLFLSGVVAQAVTAVLVAMSGDVIAVVPFLLASVAINFAGFLLGMPIAALGGVLYKGLRPVDFLPK